MKPEEDFPASRWAHGKAQRICGECMAARKCSACQTQKSRTKYSEDELMNTDALRRCKDCVPKRCCSCRKARGRRYFDARQWALDEGTALCHDCDRKRCASCSKLKGHMQFTATMWQLDDGSPELRCRECTTGKRQKGMWTCQNRQCKVCTANFRRHTQS